MRQRSKWAVPKSPKQGVVQLLQLRGLTKGGENSFKQDAFISMKWYFFYAINLRDGGRTTVLRLAPLSFFARISFHGGWQVEDELS